MRGAAGLASRRRTPNRVFSIGIAQPGFTLQRNVVFLHHVGDTDENIGRD
jgi:hypothetical protein